ncbi:MAG: hypothetical protein ACI9SK_001404 [Zhongshania sp.]|jgi:hypothetical protein
MTFRAHRPRHQKTRQPEFYKTYRHSPSHRLPLIKYDLPAPKYDSLSHPAFSVR